MPALIMSRAADPCKYLTFQAFRGQRSLRPAPRFTASLDRHHGKQFILHNTSFLSGGVLKTSWEEQLAERWVIVSAGASPCACALDRPSVHAARHARGPFHVSLAWHCSSVFTTLRMVFEKRMCGRIPPPPMLLWMPLGSNTSFWRDPSWISTQSRVWERGWECDFRFYLHNTPHQEGCKQRAELSADVLSSSPPRALDAMQHILLTNEGERGGGGQLSAASPHAPVVLQKHVLTH